MTVHLLLGLPPSPPSLPDTSCRAQKLQGQGLGPGGEMWGDPRAIESAPLVCQVPRSICTAMPAPAA